MSELFWGSGSPYSWCVMLALEFKGIDYQSRLLQMSSGETKSDEFLALNPRAQVPVYRDGETVIYESVAILAYLDRKHPQPPLFGRDAHEAGTVWRTVFELVNYLYPPAYDVILPIFFGKSEEQAAKIETGIPGAHRELVIYEARLSSQNFLAGELLSAADLILYPGLQGFMRAAGKQAAQRFNIGILPLADHYPNLKQWCGRIESLPFYDKTYPPHWRSG